MTEASAAQTQWCECIRKVSQNRDSEAFKRLFTHFAPLIKSFFVAKFPEQQGQTFIEELAQEVMLKVWNKSHTYNADKAAVSTWIFTLARNTHIDMLRRMSKYGNTSSLETEEIWEDETENGPLGHLQEHRSQETIKTSLEQLPQEQSQVIKKVYMDAKTHAEVAQELGIPLGTVKSRVRLALNKLSALIKPV